ncbi:MAG: 4-(cytidine 5'-diphospho)-2-C-methyl-D-erythritol kinase [Oscillospiraceae bacterium]|jgi:4-diphosphocytidyl-2-C-methyl-D-erythritol kinase|nr:4-(cytidine 5'-diphospho)-2-C-methyl-D-erythritol kinase [Oscillospiraceae bacterium]
MKITINAAAKINLFLEIISKRKDLLHNVESIMQSIDLYDTISVESCSGIPGIHLNGGLLDICEPHKNTTYKAAEAFLKTAKVQRKIIISCKKIIPIKAGLAGGSTDAAGVILALNKLFYNKFRLEELCKIGEKIGADVPFCLTGGCCLVKGFGENVTKIDSCTKYLIVLVKPRLNISTKEAYRLCDDLKYNPQNSTKILNALKQKNPDELSKNLHNRFENILKLKEIFELKNEFKKNGAIGCLMSGSGSCVFGIFKEKEKAKTCFCDFKRKNKKTFLCKTIDFGYKFL